MLTVKRISTISRPLTIALLILSAGIALLVFTPGLSGGFLLDDYPNLAVLNQVPANPGVSDLLELAGTGFAGLFGRPLSILSLLLQHGAWPDPFQFKLVNVLIHVGNGFLLAAVCVLLRRQSEHVRIGNLALVLVMLLWMAHPIQISSVLYVVQRMTLLAGSFVLLGILGYLLGRQWLLAGRTLPGTAFMLGAPLLGAVFGLLSKENGVLIYAYLAVVELFLQQNQQLDSRVQKMATRGVFAPLAIGVTAFLLYLPSTFEGYALRAFSLGERLLTEGPVLLSYLSSMMLPRQGAYGIFHDDFPIYSSLLDPMVLVSLLVLLGAVAVSLHYRSRFPILAFAVFWFLAGHSMESTLIPLAIYFEHRNYLPLFAVVFALIAILDQLISRQRDTIRKVAMGTAGVMLAWTLLVTIQLSFSWGDSLAHASSAITYRPGSERAQSNYVQTLANIGQPQRAYENHRAFLEGQHGRVADYIRWLEFRCLLPDIELPSPQQLRTQASESLHDYSVLNLLNQLVPAINSGLCTNLPREPIAAVIDTLLENSGFEESWPDLLMQRALLSAGAGQFALAADFAGRSERLRADVNTALFQLIWLVRADRLAEARALKFRLESDYADSIAASLALQERLAGIEQQLAL